MILYLVSVVEQKRRFVIFDLDRTRDFIFKHKSRGFDHAALSWDAKELDRKVKVSGRSLNSRVSSSLQKSIDLEILKHGLWRDFNSETTRKEIMRTMILFYM